MARRFEQSDAERASTARRLRQQENLDAYLKQIEESEKARPSQLGRELDLFHFQEKAPALVFWHPKGWTIFQR